MNTVAMAAAAHNRRSRTPGLAKLVEVPFDMGKLEVIFRLRLAHPVLLSGMPNPQAIVHFADTGNTVRLEAPQYGAATAQPSLEGFEEMTLHVERDCTHGQGTDTSYANADRLHINQDAARAFWQLFEAIRETGWSRDNTVFMYPVVPAENLVSNPLVKSCESVWIYNGKCLEQSKTGRGLPAIEITDERWANAVKRLGEGSSVPVYTRFALDAIYFAEHDPTRSIIMACAAWETALRYYLAIIASKRDPAYLVASDSRGIPRLYEFAMTAKGGPLFYDLISKATDLERHCLESYRRQMKKLGGIRNKLVHEGKDNLPKGTATDSALAVMSAIEWLFG
jgi:hypothetical protein